MPLCRRYANLLLLPSIVVAAACGASAADYDDTKPIVVKPDLVIGEGGRDPDLLFAGIMTFTADSQGFVYVADAIAREIRRYDAEGRLTWKAGRQGKGPGEFERIDYLGVGFGRVFAVDAGNSRITVLDAETGSLISVHRHRGPAPAQFTNGDPLRVAAPGVIQFGAATFVRTDVPMVVRFDLSQHAGWQRCISGSAGNDGAPGRMTRGAVI